MRTPRRRPIATAAVAAAAALALGGCSDTNFGAQTNQRYQAAVGANHVGDIDVLNTLLVANPDGTATISAGVVNHTDADDRITGVTATTLAGDTLTVTSPEEEPELVKEAFVAVGTEESESTYTVEDAPIGRYVRLTFTFADSGTAVVEAPVVERTELYEQIAVG